MTPIRSANKVNERMPLGKCCLHDEHLHVGGGGPLGRRRGAGRPPWRPSCNRAEPDSIELFATNCGCSGGKRHGTTAHHHRQTPARLLSARHVARCGGDAGVRAWGASRALLRHVTHRPPAGGARRHRPSRRQRPACHCRSIRGRPEGCSPCIWAPSRRPSCGEGVHVSSHGQSGSIGGRWPAPAQPAAATWSLEVQVLRQM